MIVSHLCSSPAFHIEACVIGAGVIGLATARALAAAGKEVLIVDKAANIGSETSSRNSEVVHAGLYYPSNSLKARFCVEGKTLLYDYCDRRSITYKNCGKLIVATKTSQLVRELESLRLQAIRNGVDDVRILKREDVHVLEPALECKGALWSPSTGVLDSHSFYSHLLADAEDNGAILVLNTTVDDAAILQPDSRGTSSRNHLNLKFSDGTWLACKTVINAAGLWADKIASYFHSENTCATTWKPPKHYFAKGNYFRLQGVSTNANPSFQHLIYPVPVPGGLGVHATIDWGGSSIKFGPNVEWVDPEVGNPNDISLDPDPELAVQFAREVRKYWPGLPPNSLVPDYVGIRPKLNHPKVSVEGTKFEDFRIIGEENHGIPGLIHLFGIESPGLTSSMAIGRHIANSIQK